MIDRNDMLELTRRMTPARSCFTRVAGAYMDRDGFIDGTFNVNFLNLKGSEKEKNLNLAKTIPFSRTNKQLVEYEIPKSARSQNSVSQVLNALKDCGLKNDAMLEVLYEKIGETYQAADDYCIFIFHGRYDVPVKGADKESQWESEETYEFLICTISPMAGTYEPGKPECGFLYPAFSNRSSYANHLNFYNIDPEEPHMELLHLITG